MEFLIWSLVCRALLLLLLLLLWHNRISAVGVWSSMRITSRSSSWSWVYGEVVLNVGWRGVMAIARWQRCSIV